MSIDGERALLQLRADVLLRTHPVNVHCRRAAVSMRWALKHINDMEREIAALHRRIAELIGEKK